jgi:2-desacetyl-2-hydroxyethyl bacteriochlorophyllide A dehydrogenase
VRGVVYRGPGSVEVAADLPEPQVTGPRDAVVRVRATGICGTDLHPYRGEVPAFEPGTVLGHEFAGEVVDAGREARWAAGDRVFASDVVACGRCERCRRGWHYQCPDVTLFGCSTLVGAALPGGQADYVRVPYADVVLSRTPDDVTDEQALFVGDVLSTGHCAVEAAGIEPGGAIGIVGAGPVGLCTAMCARAAGADTVVLADPDASRRELATGLGFAATTPDGLAAALEGHAAALVEAVGSAAALGLAVHAAAPRGTVVVVGAHSATPAPFPAGVAFARELSMRFVVGDPIRVRDRVLALLRAGLVDPGAVVSHRLPLADAVHAYDLFDRRVATKVVLSGG